MEAAQTSAGIDALKTKLRDTWMAGDFGEIAKSYAQGAEEFVNGLNLTPGMRVLDVACAPEIWRCRLLDPVRLLPGSTSRRI